MPWAAWPAGDPPALRPALGELAADAAAVGLPHALEGFARRLADPLADVLAATLALNHRLGGRNLSEVLDDLAAAIHAEAHTLREVRARQAQQRLSARLVAAAPLVILVAIRQTNPAYLAPFDTPTGQAILALALGLIVAGYGAMVRLARPPAGTRLLPSQPRGRGWPAMIQVIWWPLVAGIGLLVLLVAQPLGRPAPTLAQRLASLRPDQRPASPPPTSFASPTLERLLVPPLRAAGRRLLRAAEVCGLPTGRLARRLALAGEPGGPALHAGQKLLGGLVGLGLLPLLNQLQISPFGAWPAWTWLATAIAGFVAPDLALAHKAARRRRELLSGLGTATEFLALAVAAGCGLEQALAEAATAGHGPFFTELARRLALARLQGQSGVDATAQLAADIDLPELAALAGALQAASRQGTPVLQTLRAQAHAARERRRLGLLEAGERAQVTMIVPVATLILPAFFLVILWPASVALLRLSTG